MIIIVIIVMLGLAVAASEAGRRASLRASDLQAALSEQVHLGSRLLAERAQRLGALELLKKERRHSAALGETLQDVNRRLVASERTVAFLLTKMVERDS